MNTRIPIPGTNEAVYLRDAGMAVCEVHEWPTEGLVRRLGPEMRARMGRGGVDVCVDCIQRAYKSVRR